MTLAASTLRLARSIVPRAPSEGAQARQARLRALVALILGASLGASACQEERRPKKIFFYEPTPIDSPDLADAQADADLGQPLPMGPCAALLDGSRCELPQATGICVGGGCQLVACLQGFRDCDDQPANGCERDIASASSCGQCDRSCRPEESCQLGARGFVCSAGVVCTRGRLDVDRDPSNGCEWALRPEALSALQVSGVFEPQQGAILDAQRLIVAGRSQEDRFQAHSWAPGALEPAWRPDPAQELEASALDSLGTRIQARAGGQSDLSLTLWPRLAAVNHVELGRVGSTALLNPCLGAERWSGFVAGAIAPQANALALATRYGVLMTSGSCVEQADCLALASFFGELDYLRAFWPYADAAALDEPERVAWPAQRLTPQEVAACAPCLLDQTTGLFTGARACWGQGQCLSALDDLSQCDAACAREAAGQCPTLEPVQLELLDAQTVALLTRRGLVVLARQGASWQPLARHEERWDGQPAGARQGFARMALARQPDGSWRAALVHRSGFVRGLTLTPGVGGEPWGVGPWGPDVGLSLDGDLSQARVALGPAQTALISDGQRAVLLRLGQPGAAQALARLEDGVADFKVLDVRAHDAGYWILRESSSALLVRELAFEPQTPAGPAR